MTRVRSYRRRDGTRVSAHDRRGGKAGLATAVVAVVGVALVWQGSGGKPATPSHGPQTVRNAAAIDGDTIRVRVRKKTERVRLLAVNTPEVAASGRAGQCYSMKAKRLATALIADAKEVVLVPDTTQPDRDQHGRLLRYVMLDDVDLGATLLDRGAARVWKGTPPAERFQEYEGRQQAAKKSSAGQWGECEAARSR